MLFELEYPCSSGNNSSQVVLGSDYIPQSELLDILFLIIQTFTYMDINFNKKDNFHWEDRCIETWPFKEVQNRDFSGGSVGKNPPANAGDRGFDPLVREIPYASCATTTGAPVL